MSVRGGNKNLCAIFEQTIQQTLPVGAGEYATLKLLQHAHLNGLKPIATAELWWGESPRTEIRRHGYYYPPCRRECGLILRHMLQGLDVEPGPLVTAPVPPKEIEILLEDEWFLVIYKPGELLSVSGKLEELSTYSLLRARYPEVAGSMIVYRLDMATSGLLLVAKTKEVYQYLQAQFENHNIKKQCAALLEGILPIDEGTIDLPTCPDLLDRPKQKADRESGKKVVARYCVIDCKNGRTRIVFFPQTGRTHQLRVHPAHPSGLNCPIVGDELYDERMERFYLYVECLEFTHPASGQRVYTEEKADF